MANRKSALVSRRAGGALVAVLALFLSTCSTSDSSLPPIASLDVAPTSATILVGATQQYVATATFAAGLSQNISSSVVWTVEDARIATITTTGLATGVSKGTTTVTASITQDGTLFASVVSLTVVTSLEPTLKKITVTAAAEVLPNGTSMQLTATGTYDDAASLVLPRAATTSKDVTDKVTWSSSDDAVATVSNATDSEGMVTAAGLGSATITATLEGVSGTQDVVVKTLTDVAVTPNPATLEVDGTLQFEAAGTFSDDPDTTYDVTAISEWTSSDETVATISNDAESRGLATGVAAGDTTITATISDGTADPNSGKTDLTVSGSGGTTGPSTITYKKDVDQVMTYTETVDANAPDGYDPSVILQFNQTTSQTVLDFERNYDGGLGYFQEQFFVYWDGSGTGTFTSDAGTASGQFFVPPTMWFNDSPTPQHDAPTSLTVTAFAAVGGRVTGTFTSTLCEFSVLLTDTLGNGDECAAPEAQVVLTQGSFDIERSPNVGSASFPQELYGGMNSTAVSQFLFQAHGGVNHYVVKNLTQGNDSVIEVTSPTDNVTIEYFGTDSTFQTPATCNVTDGTGVAGTADELCAATAAGTELYFRVAAATGVTSDVTYDVWVHPPLPDLTIVITNIIGVGGGSYEVDFTITNQGDGATDGTTQFYLDFFGNSGSAPSVGDFPDDFVLIAPPVIAGGGGQWPSTEVFATGATSGTAYLIVDSLEGIPESDETNNVSPGKTW